MRAVVKRGADGEDGARSQTQSPARYAPAMSRWLE
jgi:hypothetical protein